MNEHLERKIGWGKMTMLTRLALLLLRFYKRFVSPLLPPTCRFTPTCSEYAMQAIERFGFWKGSWLALRRLLRCHPFNPGGYDPVPEHWGSREKARILLLFLLVLTLPFAAAAKDWTSASMVDLLTPPKSVEQAAKDWTEIQGQLPAVQERRDESFARLKLREAVVLVVLKREEEALQALDEAVRAYEQQLRKRNGQVNLQSFKEVALASAYFKAKLLEKRDGKNHRNVVKALEHVESLVHSSAGGVASYGSPVQDAPLWFWDEKEGEVRRYESAYEVVSNELDSIYRTGLNYQLFDALVTLFGRNPAYSYGLAVIFLALLLRILLHPLNRKAMKSMWKMQALQPLLQDLQERYRDDPQRLNAEIWKLYREHGVNPLGGCLPMLLQLPVLFWVYYGVLHYRFQFAKASFLWIANLAQPDYPLFALYLATFFASTFFMSTPTQDPTQRQQQIMMNVMFVVMFAVFLHSFPAAFILYGLSFQVFYIGESLLMKRLYYRETLPVREVTGSGEEKPKRTQKRKSKSN